MDKLHVHTFAYSKRRRFTMRAMTVIAMILLGAIVVLGQTNKGAISGTVIDSNGAAVPGATVTVTNTGTGQS